MFRALLACLLTATLLPAHAQEAEDAPSDTATTDAETREPTADESDPYRRSLWQRAFQAPDLDPGYRLTLLLVNDIALPGPLPDGLPYLIDGRVEINVAGGIARTGWEEGATATVDASPPAVPHEPAIWAVDPAGKLRARFLSSGHLVLEKRCKSCRQVWRRKWKLKVPGTVLTRPLLTENRIYYGAQDNRVYSLKKKNGHRIWVADLGDRVSAPVALWDGKVEIEDERGQARRREVQVILVVPDAGAGLIALDARLGREMARYPLSVEEGRLLGVPLKTPDGKIVVAREKYRPGEASLMVLELASGNPRPAPTERAPTDPAAEPAAPPAEPSDATE